MTLFFEIKKPEIINEVVNFCIKNFQESSMECFDIYFCRKNNYALSKYEDLGKKIFFDHKNFQNFGLFHIVDGHLQLIEEIDKYSYENLKNDFDYHISFFEHILNDNSLNKFLLRFYNNEHSDLCTLSIETKKDDFEHPILDFFQACDPKKYTPVNLIKIKKDK